MKIRLKCTYSGDPKRPGEPGDVIDLPKAEAQRLLDLNAAETVTEAEVKSDPRRDQLAALAKEKNVNIAEDATAEEIAAALKVAGVEIPA